MKKQLLTTLLIVMILNLVIDIMHRVDFSFLKHAGASRVSVLTKFLMLAVPVIFLVLFLIHLAAKKHWFIFATVIFAFVGSFAQGFLFQIELDDPYHMDLTNYHLMIKINYWIAILEAIAFIWTDRNRYGWFAVYGVLIAAQASFSYIYFASQGTGYGWLLVSTSFLPSIVLILYVWLQYKKAV